MNKICAVVVNYKNSQFTKNLCKSLSEQSGIGGEFEIECTIVDNSCCEDECKILRDIDFENLKINIIQADANLGYFGGLNAGLRVAKADFIILCNNDLYFEGDFCHRLISSAYPSNVLAVAPNVVTLDGRHQNPHLREPMSIWRKFKLDLYFSNFHIAKFLILLKSLFIKPHTSAGDILKPGPIHLGIGACYILLSKFSEKFDQLSYPHFLYGEEAYFSKQIHDGGGIIWFDPSLVVNHHESATTSEMPSIMMYNYAREGYGEYRNYL